MIFKGQNGYTISVLFRYQDIKMAHPIPPNSVGFVPNPNLILPLYIQTEVVRVQDHNGAVWTFRRPRPLSIVAGAQLVLQCDRDLLARYVV